MEIIWESKQAAHHRHYCEECGRNIEKGQTYFRQRNKDGGDVWTFKAHLDCSDLGIAYRNKNDAWRGYGDFIPMYELIEPDEFNEWRGQYPHAVCRIDFSHQTRDH